MIEVERITGSHRRYRMLVRDCTETLRQAAEVLARLTDQQYRESPAGFAPHRVGGHLRHVIEFYECLLAGADHGWVDYDARRRDLPLERERMRAQERLRTLVGELEARTVPARGEADEPEPVLRVRTEDSAGFPPEEQWLVSSFGRELQFLRSHTVHHFALIGMTLRAHGVETPADFGMAPSTLRYERGRDRAACAR